MSNFTASFSHNKQINYSLLYYAHSKFEDDWQSVIHTHPYCEIIFVTSGSGQYISNKTKTDIRQGFIIITNPNTQHTETSNKENPLEYIIFSVADLAFNKRNMASNPYDLSDDPQLTDSFIFDFMFKQTHLMDYIKLFEQEVKAAEKNHEIICQNILNSIIALIIRETEISDSTLTTSELTYNKSSVVPQQVASYLTEYYPNSFTLDFLAEKFYINKFHLIRSFKKSFDCSPIEFLNKVRLNKAMELLKSTDFSITSIASQVGFSNSSYFTKLFTAQFKTSPSSINKQRKTNPTN